MRDNYIDWTTYFMALATTASQRSKDKDKQVGSCIVDDNNNILSLGYNGLPKGMKDSVERWENNTKQLYVVHSELNAILNANCTLENSTIYCTLFPCNECAKAIAQVGIKKVVYLNEFKPEQPEMKASVQILNAAGITIEKYKYKEEKI